ncbi:MAG: 3-deoxy-D-manno-octulosonic acid transferase [Planctomycetes bacterium]|nr:3-deoxy-D-manno-octulosonic acid transferase [Planctomycetota bacterium]MCB9934375.1 3-deoxy-D-manno-octulosonic acid transferase [Planctomycetota bacterium]
MRRWLFNLGYLWLAGLIWPWFLFKYLTTGKYRAGLRQRLGGLPPRGSDRPSIWVHAVSVGELLQIKPLLAALRTRHPDHDIVITYTTKTAAEIAARDFGDYYHCYSPVDLSWVVAKFFRLLQPRLLILVELELWPNWLMHARRAGVPVLLANGRISEKSFANYRRFKWLLQPAYEAISVWAMQDETYADRAKELSGVPGPASRVESNDTGLGTLDAGHVMVAGNLKYDSLKGEPDAEKAALFRTLFSLDDRPVLVCGSTHPGEHEILVEMLPRLDCRCVLVPRHPERYESVCELLSKAGIRWVNRSALTPENPAPADAVILLDTMGELAAVYAVAEVVFIGGSLIPHGGQNMAEPVALGKATLFGPHTHNFRATVRELKEIGGAIEVQDGAGLEREIKSLLQDPARREKIGKAGQARLLASRGALQRYLELIEKLLHE